MKNSSKYILFCCCFIFAVATCLNAQDTLLLNKKFPKHALAIQPFYLINGGLRLDYEKQLSSPKEWVQFGLSGFFMPTAGGYEPNEWYGANEYEIKDEEVKNQKGGGISVGYKRFFAFPFAYLRAETSYTYYDVDFSARDYFEYIEDGLTFYQYRWMDNNQQFHKLNAGLSMGLQTNLKCGLFFDMYAGLGYAYSFYDGKVVLNNTESGYGYRGFTYSGGVKFGYAW